MRGRALLAAGAALAAVAAPAAGQAPASERSDGLLFRVSADRTLDADVAAGDPRPNFRSNVDVAAEAGGGFARWADDGYVAWKAPGNIRAARGTLAFRWRARTPVGEAPFSIFRVGYADHSSWDMAFLRVDWNGHGFDAFVTDTGLSRVRVSWRMPAAPRPDEWHHIAFAWDEGASVRLFVDGREVARVDKHTDLDAGLDQFGMAGRVLSPHQVQSRYNFMRGSDLDEIRVYDRMLAPAQVAALAAGGEPAPAPAPAPDRAAWLHRYGWDADLPPVLDAPVTRVRKVEFERAADLKQLMRKGADGIAETTWPGVYNRSRLPGRHDYFELPDWNVYVEGGRNYDLTVPGAERFNRVEVRGPAWGRLSAGGERLADRARGRVRTWHDFAARTGGTLRFANVEPEQPIQEIWAYDIGPGTVPAGSLTLDYTVRTAAPPGVAGLEALNAYIAGRHPPDERATVVALPSRGVPVAVGAGAAGGGGGARAAAGGSAPLVHLLIPAGLGDAAPDRPVARAFDYGWRNLHDGLDGIALELPAMKGRGPVAFNLRVHDPLWPGRDVMDLSFSVPAGQKRTLWLDLRDRVLPDRPIFLTLASADPGFGPASLEGARVRLVFKPRADALKEHVADRFEQVRDNWSFLVEEHTTSKRMGLYARLYEDVSDLLRVDPENPRARAYWADIGYRPENLPPVALPPAVLPPGPAGAPDWAVAQVQELGQVRRFVEWWIDHRQVPYGDFGGGLSDDSDLVQQWPGLALMGVLPDKITASLNALSDAVYRNGMMTRGLGTITTDELHAYEEGMNSDAARLYLNWGEPKAVERLMATTAALSGVIRRNPAGHLHFSSAWYGANKVYRDAPWAWQKPYGFTVMHGPTVLGVWGSPAARALVTGLADGWIAHGRQGADGRWTYPNEIAWDSDAERAGDGGGATIPLQAAWAAWRFTGRADYLRPLEGRAAANASVLSEIGDNAFDLLAQGAGWRDALAKRAGDDPFAGWARYQATRDPAPLAGLNRAGAEDKAQRMDMLTEGHWWSDRVDMPAELLQRERLGGVALRRNMQWPGHAVSWRFADPAAAERVAILVPGARPDRVRVIAHNLSDAVARAEMSTWGVTAGTWRVQRGTSTDGGRTVTPAAGAGAASEEVRLERGASMPVSFAPGVTSVIDLALLRPATPTEDRPDIGIGPDDVAVSGRRVTLTVHGLGARASGPGTASLVADDGRVLASAAVPPMEAPLDLRPRSARVTLTLPAGAKAAAATVALEGAAKDGEVTLRNNRAALR